jgi:copper transport protein
MRRPISRPPRGPTPRGWMAVPAGLALAALIGLAGPVAAHALLVSSDPAAGANLTSSPKAVTITFTEAPDARLSSIKVLDSGGQSVTAGSATAVAGASAELRISLAALKSGVYTVAWRTVSSVDGHLASGSFAFGVGVAPPSSQLTSAAEGAGTTSFSPVAIGGRWLLYAGLMIALGAAFVATVIFPSPPPLTLRLATLAWLTSVIGLAVVVGWQMLDAGIGVGGLLGTSLGSGLLLRGLPLLAAGGILAWLARRGAPSRAGLVLLGGAVTVAMLADAATSHAAASGAVYFNIFVQWLHVAAAGTWLGGLVVLVLSLRGLASEETGRIARRFATSAMFGIILVALTGVVRALSEIGPWSNLVTTDFGRLLVAKSGLLGVLAGLGAINHFRSVPAAGRILRPLRRIGSMELMVGTTVLLLSAALVNLAPPAQASSTAKPPNEIVATGSDFGTTLRVRLVATPGTSGFNTFRATLTDYDSGAPLDGRTVTLRFTFPARPDVGASQLRLRAKGNGVYQATGGNLSLDGMWHVTALITRGNSVEVALPLTTRQAPPVIDVNAVPGLPTIYTVHLRDSLTVQVDIDPGKPGANELHVTFFDAKGNELPVPGAQVSIGLAGEAPTQPRVLIMEPGHFAAHVTLKAGTYTVSIFAVPPDGAALSTQLQIPVRP